MTAKMLSLAKASLLLSVLLSTSTAALAEEAMPAPGASEDTIRAIVNPDGSLSLKGIAQYFDFGGADAGFSLPGPVGMKAITFGQHFYLNGENNKALLEQPKTTDSTSLLIDNTGFHYNVHSNESGWMAWYSALAREFGKQWKANVPGQAQIVIEVNNNKQLRLDQDVVFVPALSANDHFVTAKTDSKVEDHFAQTIKDALVSISGSDAAAFPKNSTAKSVKFLATFVADHDLSISIPDLRVLSIQTQDERSLRIIRLCTILEAGFLYDQADHLRSQLKPKSSQPRFLPVDAPHRLISMGTGVHNEPGGGLVIGGGGSDVYSIDYGSKTIQPLDPANARAANDFLDRCLKSSDYETAEGFAKKLMAAGDLAGRQKVIANYQAQAK